MMSSHPLPLDLRRRLAVGPGRDSCLVAPKQRMPLHANPMLPAPGDDLVGVRVVRLAALRLVPSPVEADRGVVEQFREPPLVGGVLGLVRAAVEHVDVAAEEEVVGRLLDGDLDAGQRPAGGVHDADLRVGLAVLLDGRLRGGDDLPLAFLRCLGQFLFAGQDRIRGPGRRADREAIQIEVAVFLADDRRR